MPVSEAWKGARTKVVGVAKTGLPAARAGGLPPALLNRIGTLSRSGLKPSGSLFNRDSETNPQLPPDQTESLVAVDSISPHGKKGTLRTGGTDEEAKLGWIKLKADVMRLSNNAKGNEVMDPNSNSGTLTVPSHVQPGFPGHELGELFYPTSPPPEESALARVRPLSNRELLTAIKDEKQTAKEEDIATTQTDSHQRGGFQFEPGLGVFRVNSDVKPAGRAVNRSAAEV